MYKRKTPLSEQSALEVYVGDMNVIRRALGEDEIEFPLSEDSVAAIWWKLGADFSPENLNCDGEISSSEANRRWKFLNEVKAELELSDDWGVTLEEVYVVVI